MLLILIITDWRLYMGNIIAYLRWRGDLPLLKYPFNKVDNPVLSYKKLICFKQNSIKK